MDRNRIFECAAELINRFGFGALHEAEARAAARMRPAEADARCHWLWVAGAVAVLLEGARASA